MALNYLSVQVDVSIDQAVSYSLSHDIQTVIKAHFLGWNICRADTPASSLWAALIKLAWDGRAVQLRACHSEKGDAAEYISASEQPQRQCRGEGGTAAVWASSLVARQLSFYWAPDQRLHPSVHPWREKTQKRCNSRLSLHLRGPLTSQYSRSMLHKFYLG